MNIEYFFDLKSVAVDPLIVFHPPSHNAKLPTACPVAIRLSLRARLYKQRRRNLNLNVLDDLNLVNLKDLNFGPNLTMAANTFYGLEFITTSINTLSQSQKAHFALITIQRSFRAKKFKDSLKSIDPGFLKEFHQYLETAQLFSRSIRLDKEISQSEQDYEKLQTFLLDLSNVGHFVKLLMTLKILPVMNPPPPFNDTMRTARKLLSGLLFLYSPAVLLSCDSSSTEENAITVFKYSLRIFRLLQCVLKTDLSSPGSYRLFRYLLGSLKSNIHLYLKAFLIWKECDKAALKEILVQEQEQISLMKGNILDKAISESEREAIREEWSKPLDSYKIILEDAARFIEKEEYSMESSAKNKFRVLHSKIISNTLLAHEIYLQPDLSLVKIFEKLDIIKIPDFQEVSNKEDKELVLELTLDNLGLHFSILQEIYNRLLETFPGRFLKNPASFESEIKAELDIEVLKRKLETCFSVQEEGAQRLSEANHIFHAWLSNVLSFMKKLCSPIRDPVLINLESVLENTANWHFLYQSFLDILIMMYYDLLEFFIQSIRPSLMANLTVMERADFDLRFPNRQNLTCLGQVATFDSLISMILQGTLYETFYLDEKRIFLIRASLNNMAILSAYAMQAEKMPHLLTLNFPHFMRHISQTWSHDFAAEVFPDPSPSNSAFIHLMDDPDNTLKKLFHTRVVGLVKSFVLDHLEGGKKGKETVLLPKLATGLSNVQLQGNTATKGFGLLDDIQHSLLTLKFPIDLIEPFSEELFISIPLLARLLLLNSQIYRGFIYASNPSL